MSVSRRFLAKLYHLIFCDPIEHEDGEIGEEIDYRHAAEVKHAEEKKR